MHLFPTISLFFSIQLQIALDLLECCKVQVNLLCHSIIQMNRFNRKRLSHQSSSKISSNNITKQLAGYKNTSGNFKESKRNLPEVCIDLDKKIGVINREPKSSGNNLKLDSYNQVKYSNNDQTLHRNITARNYIQNSQIMHTTSFSMSQLREQVQQLRMQNQSLRYQNRQLKATQEYLSNKIQKLQNQKQQINKRQQKEKAINQQQIFKLTEKVNELYERLIEQKRRNKQLIQESQLNLNLNQIRTDQSNFNSTLNPKVTKFENTDLQIRAGLQPHNGLSEASPPMGFSYQNSADPFWLKMQKQGQAAFYASLRKNSTNKFSNQNLGKSYMMRVQKQNYNNQHIQNQYSQQDELIY